MHADTTHFRAPRRARTTLAALGAASLTALSLVLGAAAPAQAHDELVGVAGELEPDGEHVVLTLQFNNEIMDVGTEIVATGADGADLIAGSPEVAGRDVSQRIAMPGFDETITVLWRVVSSDGHPISDRLDFAVVEHGDGTGIEFRETGDDAGAGEAGQGDASEHEHEHEHEHGGDEAAAGGDSPVITTLVVAAVALAAAGAVAAVIVGGRRRRAAVEAVDEAAARSEDENEQGHEETGR